MHKTVYWINIETFKEFFWISVDSYWEMHALYLTGCILMSLEALSRLPSIKKTLVVVQARPCPWLWPHYHFQRKVTEQSLQQVTDQSKTTILLHMGKKTNHICMYLDKIRVQNEHFQPSLMDKNRNYFMRWPFWICTMWRVWKRNPKLTVNRA